MSGALMDLVKGAVSKEIMGKMGGLIGQSPEKTSSVFETAAGSILGGLIKKSGSSGGADAVFKSVQNTDPGILDKLGDLMGGGKQTEEFQKQGGGVLDSVFGGGSGGIITAIAKALGLDEGSIGSLLKMAAPILMGVLAKYVKSKALDAVGLGKFLGDQKSSLGNYLPSGLAGSLGLGNLVGDVSGKAGSAAKNLGSSATSAANNAAKSGGSALKWLIPLILIGALGFLGYTWWSSQNKPEITQNPDDGIAPTRSMGGGGPPVVDIPTFEMPSFEGMELGGFDVNGLKDKFAGISDGFSDLNMENAPALKDKIAGLTSGFGEMGFDKIPEVAKGPIGSIIDNFKTTVTGKMEKVEDQGILDMLKPVLEKLWEALKGFGFGS